MVNHYLSIYLLVYKIYLSLSLFVFSYSFKKNIYIHTPTHISPFSANFTFSGILQVSLPKQFKYSLVSFTVYHKLPKLYLWNFSGFIRRFNSVQILLSPSSTLARPYLFPILTALLSSHIVPVSLLWGLVILPKIVLSEIQPLSVVTCPMSTINISLPIYACLRLPIQKYTFHSYTSSLLMTSSFPCTHAFQCSKLKLGKPASSQCHAVITLHDARTIILAFHHTEENSALTYSDLKTKQLGGSKRIFRHSY